MPLAGRDQRSGRAVVVIVIPAAPGFQVGLDSVRDCCIRAARLVLVDHRDAFAVVTHAGHQVLSPAPLDAANVLLALAAANVLPAWRRSSRTCTQGIPL